LTKVSVEKRKDGKMRAIVIKADGDVPQAPSKAIVDPWENITIDSSQGIISPPFDPIGLQSIYEMSSELQSNIDAMSTNIPGFGWRLKRLPYTLPVEGKEPDELLELHVQEEKQNLEAFLTYIDYDDQSFTKLRGRYREDQEVTGNAYIEVVRDLGGRPANWRFMPAYTMRTTMTDPTVIPIAQKQRMIRNGHSVMRYVRKQKRFRKFVQAKVNGPFGYSTTRTMDQQPSMVWFKQYGDPRTMDWRTGDFIDDPSQLDPQWHATEILHIKNESSRSVYGIPRWIGALVPLLGVRSAEEINFSTFKNNNIPSLAILVSGGSMTEGSIERIGQFVESSIQGDDNYSKILILEAEGIEDDMGDMANVRMQIQPLTSEQHTDALFTNYDQRSREKIRQSFRLPPIYVGRAEDYTRSTADVSRRIADEQIFNPERLEEDHLINRFLLQEFDMVFHEFVTNTPNITNDEDLVRVMAGAEKTGGMTPRIAHSMLEDLMGREMSMPQDVKLDVPFSLQMAEAVKNEAMPNEVGQQVTALKSEIAGRIQKALDDGYEAEEILSELFESGATAGLTAKQVLQLLGYRNE
jgi:PBSX family phage portal protein